MDPNSNQPIGPQNGGVNPASQPVPPAPPMPPAPGATMPPSNPVVPGMSGPEPAMPPTPSGAVISPMGDVQGQGGLPPKPSKPKKPFFIALGVVSLVIVIAVAAYFLFLKKDTGTGESNSAAKKSTTASQATEMSTLTNVQLNVPDSIPGFQSRETGVAGAKDFLSDDGKCELIAGVVSASQLPGADLNAIVDPQLKALRSVNATIVGPNAGTALELKDTVTGKLYSMPTLNFEFSQAEKHAAVHYSAVILKNDMRVAVNRTCINANGEVDASRLKEVDEIAKTLTITATP